MGCFVVVVIAIADVCRVLKMMMRKRNKIYESECGDVVLDN